MPKRVQLRRVKGYRKPADAVVVSRPTKWGNPFAVGTWVAQIGRVPNRYIAKMFYDDLVVRHDRVLEAEAKITLAGRDLACWCPLCPDHADGKPMGIECDDCAPCHADVLLEISNE